mgnify:CR=1 FL=1
MLPMDSAAIRAGVGWRDHGDISPSPSCPLDGTAGELASSLWSWGVPGGDPMIRGAKGGPLIIINREKGGCGFVGNPPPSPRREGGAVPYISV